jgi:hypothetical protein
MFEPALQPEISKRTEPATMFKILMSLPSFGTSKGKAKAECGHRTEAAAQGNLMDLLSIAYREL